MISDLYLGTSRRTRPLPRGVAGHVAHPIRSIQILISNKRKAFVIPATTPATVAAAIRTGKLLSEIGKLL